MSDVMLHGVLNMPPELWGDGEIDKIQRHDRYKEASQRIKALELDLGMVKISLDHKTILLESCEKALAERDGKLMRAAPEWISVSDRLPEDDVHVLFLTEEGDQTVGSVDRDCNGPFFKIGHDCIGWDYDFNKGCTVTHWQQLPGNP